MQDLMTTEQVLSVVQGKGTRIATITFLKADGSLRTVNGLFRATSHIVGSERGKAQGVARAKRQQVAVYEIASKHWKSFFADSVVEIK
jgi:hypothetical protein